MHFWVKINIDYQGIQGTVMNKNSNGQQAVWIAEIVILSFVLSVAFNAVSSTAVHRAYLPVACLILAVIILIGVLFDMIGTAAAAADTAPLNAMASKKIKGARTAVTLVKNAPKVSSICNDVVGDICGIISGATAAAIIIKISSVYALESTVLISVLLSGAVAALTIGGKAVAKEIAISNSTEIILAAAKAVELFTPSERKKNGKKGKA